MLNFSTGYFQKYHIDGEEQLSNICVSKILYRTERESLSAAGEFPRLISSLRSEAGSRRTLPRDCRLVSPGVSTSQGSARHNSSLELRYF